MSPRAGKPHWRGRFSTVDLLIKIGCFVKKGKYSFSLKNSLSKLVSTRRLMVLSLPLQWGFPGEGIVFYLAWNRVCCSHLHFVVPSDLSLSKICRRHRRRRRRRRRKSSNRFKSDVLYCIVLYCIVLYCIVLYCIVLYCIVLYCIVLYCIVLYFMLPCIIYYKHIMLVKYDSRVVSKGCTNCYKHNWGH